MPAFPSQPSILIIGAGPAGAVAAVLLGRVGCKVTLIEQQTFPRDKVCGECLSALGIEVLRSAGLADALLHSLHPVILRRSLFFAQDGSQKSICLPNSMWGVSRARLDTALLDIARRHCKLIQPARCEAIHASVDSPSITIRRLDSNLVETFTGDLVLLADGKAGLMPAKPSATDDFGLKSHWRGIDAPPEAIELFGVGGHYGGVAPIEDGRFNVSFSIPSPRLRAFRGDHDALFDAVINENAALRWQFRFARRVGPWLASPLARYRVAAQWPAGVIPLGAAAAALEPIGGEGMGLAMRSAQIVSVAVQTAAAQGKPIDLHNIRQQFRALWTVRSYSCRLAAQVISRPLLAGPVIDLLNCAPAVAGTVMKLIGK